MKTLTCVLRRQYLLPPLTLPSSVQLFYWRAERYESGETGSLIPATAWWRQWRLLRWRTLRLFHRLLFVWSVQRPTFSLPCTLFLVSLLLLVSLHVRLSLHRFCYLLRLCCGVLLMCPLATRADFRLLTLSFFVSATAMISPGRVTRAPPRSVDVPQLVVRHGRSAWVRSIHTRLQTVGVVIHIRQPQHNASGRGVCPDTSASSVGRLRRRRSSPARPEPLWLRNIIFERRARTAIKYMLMQQPIFKFFWVSRLVCHCCNYSRFYECNIIL